ncbi:PTS sugar transporter subunit IIA [Photobacterium satsumensis]|uniref:PTS sugar transporter subunit IIA n=1 Tax=Photobacterium satsumensis TaxID=2910239 RepID=UPI003D14EBB8
MSELRAMIERRITFTLDDEGLPAWKLNRLKTLAGHFRSVVVIHNISQLRMANAEQAMRMMSLGSMPGDLCQLMIEGSDAELACMVLTDFISEHSHLICTGHRHLSQLEGKGKIVLPFDYELSHIPQLSQFSVVSLDKSDVLMQISRQCAPNQPDKANRLLEQMQAREAISSTAMGNGVALPHILTPDVEVPTLVLAPLEQPIEWGSKRGPVSCVVGLVLPAPPQREYLLAFSSFSKRLLEPDFCQLLTENARPEVLRAVVLDSLSQPFR